MCSQEDPVVDGRQKQMLCIGGKVAVLRLARLGIHVILRVSRGVKEE
jgi:hypothetical protein